MRKLVELVGGGLVKVGWDGLGRWYVGIVGGQGLLRAMTVVVAGRGVGSYLVGGAGLEGACVLGRGFLLLVFGFGSGLGWDWIGCVLKKWVSIVCLLFLGGCGGEIGDPLGLAVRRWLKLGGGLLQGLEGMSCSMGWGSTVTSSVSIARG